MPVYNGKPLSPFQKNIETFWLEDISSLYRYSTIFPTAHMTLAEKLNSLTRLVLLISFILFLIRCRLLYILIFFGISLAIIILLYYRSRKENFQKKLIENYLCNSQIESSPKPKLKLRPRKS
jgi:cell division protein FtsW (lipid II flippase)